MRERKRIRRLLSLLNRQRAQRFPAPRCSVEAPEKHGVYLIRDRRNRVVHVGRTYRGKAGLCQRLRNHLAAQSSFVKAFLDGDGSRLREGYTYQYLEVHNDRDRALLEYLATAWHCAKHLGVHAARVNQSGA